MKKKKNINKKLEASIIADIGDISEQDVSVSKLLEINLDQDTMDVDASTGGVALGSDPAVMELWRQLKDKTAHGSLPVEHLSSSSDHRQHAEPQASESVSTHEKTVAVEGYGAMASEAQAAPQTPPPSIQSSSSKSAPKLEFQPIGARGGVSVSSVEAVLVQAESLKIAQERITDLELELENSRRENEELSSVAELYKQKLLRSESTIVAIEKHKQDAEDKYNQELHLIRENLVAREREVEKYKVKVEELDFRLKSDLKKIRVRERELENRLELLKEEKATLVRAKDDIILDLKRRLAHLENEIENYRETTSNLNRVVEANQEQFRRTIRALRLAMSSLESNEQNIVPLKKAD